MANVKTPKFRLSYPNLFRPKLNDLNGKMEYSCVALFKKGEDLSALEAAAKKVLEEKFGTDKSKWPKNLKSPFRDQGDREKEVDGKMVLPEGYEHGAIFLNLKSTQRPGIVDQNVQQVLDESEAYAGRFAHCTVNPYYFDQKGNKGIAFGLVNLQLLDHGDPLSGRTKPEDDFAPVASEAGSASDLFS